MKIHILKTTWDPRSQTFYESDDCVVDGRETAKSIVIHYGDGHIRKVLPKFLRDGGLIRWWTLSYLPLSRSYLYAYTEEGWINRVKRPTFDDLVKGLT